MHKIINNRLFKIVVIYDDIVFELVGFKCNRRLKRIAKSTTYLLNNEKHKTI